MRRIILRARAVGCGEFLYRILILVFAAFCHVSHLCGSCLRATLGPRAPRPRAMGLGPGLAPSPWGRGCSESERSTSHAHQSPLATRERVSRAVPPRGSESSRESDRYVATGMAMAHACAVACGCRTKTPKARGDCVRRDTDSMAHSRADAHRTLTRRTHSSLFTTDHAPRTLPVLRLRCPLSAAAITSLARRPGGWDVAVHCLSLCNRRLYASLSPLAAHAPRARPSPLRMPPRRHPTPIRHRLHALAPLSLAAGLPATVHSLAPPRARTSTPHRPRL